MRRILRFFIIGFLALVLLTVAAAGLAVIFIKPNDYKPQLIAAVKRATGRTLVLQGDLVLSVFPSISIQAGPAELQDDAAFGPEPFVRIKTMRAHMALLPLLRGSVEIGEVALEGVRLKLVVTQTGQNNWDMRADPAGAGASDAVTTTPLADGSASGRGRASRASIGIADLRLEDVVVTYRHLGTGEAFTATIAKFTAEDLAPGQKSSFTFAGSAADEKTKQKITLALKGSFLLGASLDKDSSFSFSGQVDKTTISGEGGFALRTTDGVASPSLTGKFRLGDLDLDHYMAEAKTPPAAPAGRSAAAPQAAGDDPSRLEMLRTLALDLSLTADSVTVSKLSLRTIQARIQASKGEISLSPCTLTLAEGALALDIKADARGQDLRSTITGTLNGARVGQIVQALTGKQSLTGNLNLTWDVAGTGMAWPAMSRTLEGRASLALTRGLLPGFQLIPEGIPGVPARRQDVNIERFSGTWRIARGIATTNDIVLEATALSARGSGTFNIPNQTMDSRIAISVPALPEIPARITGPLASPTYTVDAEALLRNTARGVLQTPGRATEGLGRATEGIGRGLGGVLGTQPPKRR